MANKEVKFVIEVKLSAINISNTEANQIADHAQAIVQYCKDGLVHGVATDPTLRHLVDDVKLLKCSHHQILTS